MAKAPPSGPDCLPPPAREAADVRRRNAAATKAAILSAAQVAFSTVGYAHVGVREIAATAGVDRALIVRYFGSKEGLFEAVLSESLAITPFYRYRREEWGKQIVRFFLEESHAEPNPIRVMILAATDPTVRALSMQIEERLVIEPLAAWLGPPDATARATNLVMLWAGFFLYWNWACRPRQDPARHPPLARRSDPGDRRWEAPQNRRMQRRLMF